MAGECQILCTVNEILKVEGLEEGFSCFLIHRAVSDRKAILQKELQNALANLPPEQQEASVKQILITVSGLANVHRLRLILDLMHNMVASKQLSALMVCESILSCPNLYYKNADFWVECFNLIRKIIGGVWYKGVREIMKGCRDKAQTIPARLNASALPQLKAVLNVLEHIFDRNACLLPSYMLLNDLYAAHSIWKNLPHWKVTDLISSLTESFRPTARMMSIIGQSQMRPVVLHTGNADCHGSQWKLDPTTLRLSLKGVLPYDHTLLEPQTGLLRYVLEQPYSRDMVCAMLGLQKIGVSGNTQKWCRPLELQLVELVITAMERTEAEPQNSSDSSALHHMWLHISSLIVHFLASSNAQFSTIVLFLNDKLANRDLRRGRDYLMWVMLQFISGSISKHPVASYFCIIELYDTMYPENEPLPVPDVNDPLCTHSLAACCIWIHLFRKAQLEHTTLSYSMPIALKNHYEFLQQMLSTNIAFNVSSDFRPAILCNAYSTNQDCFNRPMNALADSLKQTQQTGMASAPLSMVMLDSLSSHCKMTLIQAIMNQVISNSKSNQSLTPALVETYSRLLVYTELESLGIKGFISQVLPPVFKAHAWGIMYTLLEMFSYRMHHIQPHYRIQLLSHLHNLAAVPQTNLTQLHLCVESTALRLITGLGSAEVQPELSRLMHEPKQLVSAESEELNRVLVLTIARAMHIMGSSNEAESTQKSWCNDLLMQIMTTTPHNWATRTLEYFPPVLRDFFQKNAVPVEDHIQLKKAVEEEHRNWASMNNDNDLITHFSRPNAPPLFLCLLWKVILETERISPIIYKILERIGARALSTHLRKFCDYLLNEFSQAEQMQPAQVEKCVEAVNAMMWNYNILTIDRLVLCLLMRPSVGEISFFIIQLVLLKSNKFRSRVHEFVRDNSPEHWKQNNWYEKHVAFHRNFPETLPPEGRLEQTGGVANPFYSLPVYFGNVCLRFLPVFDNLIHRFLEMPHILKSFMSVLENLGLLYKFHDHPVTYLYNTLHYYEPVLRDQPKLKVKLVSTILGNLPTVGHDLSEQYHSYMREPTKAWLPELPYYMKLVQRVVDTMAGRTQLSIDWRFNEFPNAASHALYVTCVELMGLPVSPTEVGNKLLDVIMRGYTTIPAGQFMSWVNVIGLIMAALPTVHWDALEERLITIMTCPQMVNWPYRNSPFQLFDLNLTHDSLLENKFSYMLALAHSIWHHSGIGQIPLLPQMVKKKMQHIVKTEEQLLFLCHLLGPFFPRVERDTCLMVDMAKLLFNLLVEVDHSVNELRYIDQICDMLYHIKYIFVGDTLQPQVQAEIQKMRPELQMRLRFITHLSIEEIKSS